MEGLLYGCGDAVIGVNPATESVDTVSALLHGLDEFVLGAGGRHYLAKDGHTTPEAIRRGYPRLDEWRAVRAAADPGRVWVSDLSRRLCLLAD